MTTGREFRCEALSKEINRMCSDPAAAAELMADADGDGRIRADAALEVWQKYIFDGDDSPENGWLEHTYLHLRGRVFPHLRTQNDSERFSAGRASLLDFLHAIYKYEQKYCAFDPVKDFRMLPDREIRENGYTREYIRMKKLAYEFTYENDAISAGVKDPSQVLELMGLGGPANLAKLGGSLGGADAVVDHFLPQFPGSFRCFCKYQNPFHWLIQAVDHPKIWFFSLSIPLPEIILYYTYQIFHTDPGTLNGKSGFLVTHQNLGIFI